MVRSYTWQPQYQSIMQSSRRVRQPRRVLGHRPPDRADCSQGHQAKSTTGLIHTRIYIYISTHTYVRVHIHMQSYMYMYIEAQITTDVKSMTDRLHKAK